MDAADGGDGTGGGDASEPGQTAGPARAKLLVACGLVLAAAVIAAVLVSAGANHRATSTTSTTVARKLAVAVVPSTIARPSQTVTPVDPSTTPPTTPPVTTPSVTTTTLAPTVTGTVTDQNGNPIAGASVIGLANLAVATTDTSGNYSMPCTNQALVASSWLLPMDAPHPGPSGGYAYGTDTTLYASAFPSTPGTAYVFSGGTTDISQAVPLACDGLPVNFTLPFGATVDLFFVDPSGAPYPVSMKGTGTPVADIYIPGLDTRAAIETPPSTGSTNEEILNRLGTGDLGIDETLDYLSCTAPGVPPPAEPGNNLIPVVAGQTVTVTCTVDPV